MAKQPSETPHPQPKTPQQEADALIEELTHPPDPNAPGPEPTSREKTVSVISATLRVVRDWVVIPLAIVLTLHYFVFQAYQVVGSSMEPTLQGGNYLIISKIGQSISKLRGPKKHPFIPKHSQVVVFIFPDNPKLTFVKRVIGIPGDRVVVKDGAITVFNKEHPEGYNPDVGYKTSEPITLGNFDAVIEPGHIFVVGDNRIPGASYDSRDWGPLPSEYIIGIAELRLLPISGMRFLQVPVVKF